jgi:ATP-dependent Clp protease, protease subunit
MKPKIKPKFRGKVDKAFLTPYRLTELEYMLKELEYGMDVASNTIFLNSEVSTESLYETVGRFNFLMKCNGTQRHILLNISSFGGDVYSMFGIHDYMRTLPIKVDTICVGPAMSAAAFLLASGTGTRFMTENSTVMFHQFSTMMEGKTAQVVSNASHVKKLQSRADELLGKYTKKPKSYWEKETKEDLYLSATECLQFGIVDKIVSIGEVK